MRGALVSLVLLARRLAVALVVALALAVVIALARDDSSFLAGVRVGMLVVGCLTLLFAFGGSSPGRRLAADRYAAYLFPELHRRSGEPYGGHVLSDSAVFALVGIVLIALAAVLPS